MTTVLGEYKRSVIEKWRARVGEEKADKICREAAKRGDELHKQVELYMMEDSDHRAFPYTFSWKSYSMFLTLKTIIDHQVTNVQLQEKALYSRVLGVAGRVDLIADYAGVPSIIDFKGSTREKKEEWVDSYFMQTSAYAMMYFERTRRVIKQTVILMCAENGAPQIFVRPSHEWLPKFKKARDEYRTITGI